MQPPWELFKSQLEENKIFSLPPLVFRPRNGTASGQGTRGVQMYRVELRHAPTVLGADDASQRHQSILGFASLSNAPP